jgi:hypothetical protein
LVSQGEVISSAYLPDAQEIAAIQTLHPGLQVKALTVTLPLSRQLPAWYLAEQGIAGFSILSDIPGIPKPRPLDMPHLILDFSALLK